MKYIIACKVPNSYHDDCGFTYAHKCIVEAVTPEEATIIYKKLIKFEGEVEILATKRLKKISVEEHYLDYLFSTLNKLN